MSDIPIKTSVIHNLLIEIVHYNNIQGNTGKLSRYILDIKGRFSLYLLYPFSAQLSNLASETTQLASLCWYIDTNIGLHHKDGLGLTLSLVLPSHSIWKCSVSVLHSLNTYVERILRGAEKCVLLWCTSTQEEGEKCVVRGEKVA